MYHVSRIRLLNLPLRYIKAGRLRSCDLYRTIWAVFTTTRLIWSPGWKVTKMIWIWHGALHFNSKRKKKRKNIKTGFHMIATLTTVAEELFQYENDCNDYWTFFASVLAIVVMVAILWKADLNASMMFIFYIFVHIRSSLVILPNFNL